MNTKIQLYFVCSSVVVYKCFKISYSYPNMTLQQEKTTSRLNYLHNLWKMYTKKKSVMYGLPFLIFMVGGSMALKEWTQVRYQFAKVKGVSKEEAEKMGLHRDKKVTLEGVYDEIKTLDIDNWENKRGPRPWESTEQKQ